MAAPHCFGQAACFHPTCCLSCPSCADCAQSVLVILDQVAETLDVSAQVANVQSVLDRKGYGHVRMELYAGKALSAPTEPCPVDDDLSGLNVNVRRIVKAVKKAGIDMRLDIERGINRLERLRPTYLCTLQSHLIEHRALSKSDLRAIIAADRDTSNNRTINNHVSYATKALLYMNVITAKGDGYVLS